MSEVTIDTNSGLNQEPDIINDIIGEPTEPPKGSQQEPDIDELFGTGDPLGNGTQQPTGDPTHSSQGKKNMDPQEYMRELQSRADKALNQAKMLEAQNKELAGAAEFVNQLYEDPDVFKAFVAEINPDLVKPSNPEDYIVNRLKKEFGEDFVPDPSEENIRGSRTWLYNKRADDLYEEAINATSKVPDTIKSLREKRLKEQQELEAKAIQEKNEILQSLNWDENIYNNFLNWANKVRTIDFAKLYDRGIKRKSQRVSSPSLAGAPSGTPINEPAYMQELTKFFG